MPGSAAYRSLPHEFRLTMEIIVDAIEDCRAGGEARLCLPLAGPRVAYPIMRNGPIKARGVYF
jgi:hypothetical protein